MKIGKRGKALIKGYEKLRLKAYKPVPTDPWTIGWGHTAGVRKGDRITKAEAERLFVKDLEWCERRLNRCGPMKQSCFDGTGSLLFNIGGANFRTSKIRKLLKARNYADCDLEFPKWRRAGGKIRKGLRRRRAAELNLFTED